MALALAGVLVLAVVVWLGRGLLPGAPATGPTRLVAVDAMEPVAEDRQTDAAPPEPPRPAPSTVALLRPEQTGDATRQAEPAPLPTPQRQQPQAIAAPSAAAPAAPRQTAPVAPTAMAAAAPPTERDRVSPAATVQAEPSFRDSNVASAATTAKAAAPAPATVAAAPLAQMPPMRLSDLPVSQREQLPPLRMSMHLWAPTQRLAIIDGAHNPPGADVCADVFFGDFHPEGRRILVVGTLREPSGMLAALRADEFDVVHACTAPSPRGVPGADVARAARELGCAEV
ncbi:MAG: hypothetical protein KY442_12385, partial [Proteobacteria bacterium]|nr:hypothetical protein [Pseudomonadota bacterium]